MFCNFRSSDEDTKRLGMLNLVNQLFKVYFRINKLHLCKPLIRAIDSSAYKDSFPLAQQITYKYFVGRKAMFDSDYKSADEYLSYAFNRCHKRFPKNKRYKFTKNQSFVTKNLLTFIFVVFKANFDIFGASQNATWLHAKTGNA